MPTSPVEVAPTDLNACTIVARNYLAQAQVLADSFRRHHSGGRFTVLVIDDDQEQSRPEIVGADVRLLDEIGLPAASLTRMAITYDLMELATGVKPWLLEALLDGPHDHAVYFDPDILLTREVSELADLVRHGSVVLTPHTTEPMPRDGKHPSEQDILLAGVYNLGFIAVADDDNGRRMLAWWQARLLSDCRDDKPHGFFTDQRWIDFVPSLFEHHIVRDPSWNVAYWNLATRPLSALDDGSVVVAGHPLTFMHFSGYSPHFPHLLSKHQSDDPRVRLSDQPILRRLCDDYGSRLVEAGYLDAVTDFRRPFQSFDGVQLDPLSRRLVTQELKEQDVGLGTGLVLDTGAGLRSWLMTPPAVGSVGGVFGPYFSALWLSRGDLHSVYPEVRQGDPARFLDWCELFGTSELGLARWPLEEMRARLDAATGVAAPVAVSRSGRPTARGVPGAEVVGYFSADLGIGQAARMLVAGLEAAGVDVSTTTYTRTSSRLGTSWTDRPPPEHGHHDVAIVCINADMLPVFIREDDGETLLADRYRVGFWFWELDDFPERFRPALEPLDEIWVTSEFTADVLKEVTDIPIRTLPLPVHAPVDTGMRVSELGDDGGVFTFLFVFDYLSVIERKNPHGLVDAFARAFPEPGQARLVLKTINADKKRADQEKLRYAVRDRPDIVLIERYLSREELDGLMWAADCYVSLHRSEGFGFTMAEAMAIGKPVIATGYSGNMTFMTKQNSRLVDYHLVGVPPGCEPYPQTSRWASPRIGQAARMMRRVRDDAELRDRLAARAASDIARRHSVEALADFAQRRLLEIRDEQVARGRGHKLRARARGAARRLAQFQDRVGARPGRDGDSNKEDS